MDNLPIDEKMLIYLVQCKANNKNNNQMKADAIIIISIWIWSEVNDQPTFTKLKWKLQVNHYAWTERIVMVNWSIKLSSLVEFLTQEEEESYNFELID